LSYEISSHNQQEKSESFEKISVIRKIYLRINLLFFSFYMKHDVCHFIYGIYNMCYRTRINTCYCSKVHEASIKLIVPKFFFFFFSFRTSEKLVLPSLSMNVFPLVDLGGCWASGRLVNIWHYGPSLSMLVCYRFAHHYQTS